MSSCRFLQVDANANASVGIRSQPIILLSSCGKDVNVAGGNGEPDSMQKRNPRDSSLAKLSTFSASLAESGRPVLR